MKRRAGILVLWFLALAWVGLAPRGASGVVISRFRRGDSNADSRLNISDAIHTLVFLFSGRGEPACMEAADANDDGAVNISDPVYLLAFLFAAGPALPPPGTECGRDPTLDALGCASGEPCLETVPELPELDPRGEYTPYYATDELHRPRYYHEAMTTKAGDAIVFGGTDERGLSGLNTIEVFDQLAFEEGKPRPASLAGLWIDTDFEGNPIAFQQGPRMLFTVNELADGRILCAGGVPDLLAGDPYEKAEVFDPVTRSLVTLEAKMVRARFRHASVVLSDGAILLLGGQIKALLSIVDPRIPEELLGRGNNQETRWLTTPECEVYSPRDGSFALLTFPETARRSRLTTPRGRAGHAVARLAGFDQSLGTGDDLFIVAGGFQTWIGQFAPKSKPPGTVGRGEAVGLTALEFFDPVTQTFTQVSSVALAAPRINDPSIVNLGQFNDYTPDGVKGMGNLVLITHGNTDESCPEAPLADELLVATFTGFGPGQGIQLFEISEESSSSHSQGAEYSSEPAPIDLRGNLVGRCAANPVALPRSLMTAPGVGDVETWIIAAGGADVVDSAGNCSESISPTIRAGCVFDPFFSLPAVQSGLSPRDLASQRSASNPLGVVGCWLTLDGAIPTTDLSAFKTTPPDRWAKAIAPRRLWGKNVAIAGEDGFMGTPDDRVLLTGGSDRYGDGVSVGGEPTAPSAEILLPPGVNAKTPSP